MQDISAPPVGAPETRVVDDPRVAALYSFDILDTPPEPDFEDLVLLAQSICGTRFAVINLIDVQRQWFKAEIGFGVRETSLEPSICAKVMLTPALVEIPDLTLDHRFDCNPLVTGEPGLRYYCGVPLATAEGHILGTLCVLHAEPMHLSDGQKTSLAALGRQTMAQMELRRVGRLAAARATALAAALERRLAAERERQASETAQQHVMDQSQAGLVVHDSDGLITFANAAAAELLGLSNDQLRGRAPVDPAWHFIDESGRRLEPAQYPVSIAMRTGQPLRNHGIGIVRARAAEPLWVLVNAYPQQNGDGTGLERTIVSFIDVTQARQDSAQLAETARRLQFTLEAAEIGEWELDLVAGSAHRSLRHDRCFGYTEPLAHWDLETFARHVHPDDRADVLREYERGLAEGNDWRFECRVVWPDGSVHWIAASGSVYQRDTRPTRMSGIVYDITQRKNAELELRHADRRKDEFLAMLAHELRNPLAPISAAALLLEKGPVQEARVRRTSQIITRQVRHMTELVDDLLDVSRVTRGLVELDRRPEDLGGIVWRAVEQARPLLEARRHHLVVDVAPGAALVHADEKRLVQVLVNLLNNAAKYTPDGGDIRVTTLAAEPDHWAIVVQDNGIGIPIGLQQQVFDLFSQAERTPDRQQGGLGIGLALVRSLVELHQGRVACSSAGTGLGSRFTVTLPRHHGAPMVPAVVPPDVVQPADGQCSVLIVDDNIDAAESLAMLLQEYGHRVAVEYGSRSGLARAQRDLPDLCLLDIGLPDMDGMELARQLRQDPRTRPAVLVAVSGYGQEQDRQSALDAGFDHYLVKPAHPDQLGEILTGLRSG